MRSNLLVRGLGSSLPYAGLALIGLVGVTTAMTILGTGEIPSVVPPSAAPTPTTTAGPTPSPTFLDVFPTVAVPSSPPRLTTETTRLRGPGGRWMVVFEYPQFVADTTPLAYLLNVDIRTEIETRIDRFAVGAAAIPDPGGATSWLVGEYSVDLLAPRVACLLLRWTDNPAAGGQPMSYGFQALNYDLASARRIDLGEVFTDLPAALNIVSTESRAQLRTILGDDYDSFVVDSGTEPLAANFTGWSLTPEGFKVTLAMYQVAGRKHGMPAVVIPWSSLAGVVRADGPAAAVAAQALLLPSASPSAAPPSVSPSASISPGA